MRRFSFFRHGFAATLSSALAITLVATDATSSLFAQESSEGREIETDRDSFTPALTTVEQGRVMVESAWSFIDNKDTADSHSLPELLVRIGWTENVELRFGSNYEVGGEASDVSARGTISARTGGSELEEETSVSYGVKTLLVEQSGWVPQSALTLAGSTPVSGGENVSRFIGSYVLGWELPNEMTIASGLRYGTGVAEEDHFNSWAPSAVIKAPILENINVHAEYFGIFSDGREQETAWHFFSPGVHFLLSPNLEVGVRTGWGLNEQSANFFSNIGFGWQY